MCNISFWLHYCYLIREVKGTNMFNVRESCESFKMRIIRILGGAHCFGFITHYSPHPERFVISEVK